MHPTSLDASAQPTPRILIFVVAYNATGTLSWVLDRIPGSLRHENVEVLVIDDSSPDNTFLAGMDTSPVAARTAGSKSRCFAILRISATVGTRNSVPLCHRQRV